jgi:hypothetical protein
MEKKFEIVPAEKKDVPIILSFIEELADHINLSHEVVVTEKDL